MELACRTDSVPDGTVDPSHPSIGLEFVADNSSGGPQVAQTQHQKQIAHHMYLQTTSHKLVNVTCQTLTLLLFA